MARIRKEDHAIILERVDVQRQTVREIAIEYGCTPAAIYALLKKLRREESGAVLPAVEIQEPLALEPVQVEPSPVEPAEVAALPEPPPPLPPQPLRVVSAETPPMRAPEPVRLETKIGAKLAKPGMGLAMRTADGEETMTPFRSVDDLLSAIKPILRASARSPDPVWFSLQPVDLSTIDVDAA